MFQNPTLYIRGVIVHPYTTSQKKLNDLIHKINFIPTMMNQSKSKQALKITLTKEFINYNYLVYISDITLETMLCRTQGCDLYTIIGTNVSVASTTYE